MPLSGEFSVGLSYVEKEEERQENLRVKSKGGRLGCEHKRHTPFCCFSFLLLFLRKSQIKEDKFFYFVCVCVRHFLAGWGALTSI